MSIIDELKEGLGNLIKKTNYSVVFDKNAVNFDREVKRIAHILAEQLIIATMDIKDSDGLRIDHSIILNATVEKLNKFSAPIDPAMLADFMDVEKTSKTLAATDIIDIIGKYVTLQEAGNGYVSCCPFHKEETPSFSANKAKQSFHCFGCGISGDVVDFLCKHDDLTFHEALIKLQGFIDEKKQPE